MSYEVQTERFTALHTDLTLTKDKTEPMAKLTVQYKKDKGELHVKQFRSSFSGEFMRATGKTPAEALFEYALTQFNGTQELNLLIVGNLQTVLEPRSLAHYTKVGLLKPVKENTWEVDAGIASRMKVQTEF